jgi:hypothetical protein
MFEHLQLGDLPVRNAVSYADGYRWVNVRSLKFTAAPGMITLNGFGQHFT